MVLLLLVDLDADLAALRPLGGFFLLRTGAAPRSTLPTLAQAYQDEKYDVYGNSMTFRIQKVSGLLSAPEPRIAASIAHQGLASRLWSAALACAVLYGRIPDLDARLVRWDADGSAPDDLWLTEVRPLPGDAASLAEAVLEGHLEPLAEALRTRYRVAAGLLRGNAASALTGAARQLAGWARANDRPDAVARTRALVTELLAHPGLAGALDSGTLRRRSCCLYYRVPGGGVCGDCCFTRPPRSSPGAASG
ncbi:MULTISPECIES: (2Fe-2S)-binding protein [unclassified Streptomyces]|uniref:(2Fe-2S)-binding protein n=1 Tax=unclassified Streptomyces TaxID=2593676 RepID=UPI002252DEF2|nr:MULTISPECIES: (2Fe-2S)-binding protein [unclassified Streptomyces]MCX5329765.1 (2Fe-2S)-binding protein [Streptomyces sp. NBC_00140]MCX5359180.1 (2Fe-2S)-binding protein [Streptomyces sp. NBC_00124]